MVNTAHNQAVQPFGRPLPVNKPYVVVIFGHTGVGISSLVNLISEHPVSKESPDAKSATTYPKIKPHTVPIRGSGKQFWLYEVPGFGGCIPDETILKTIHQIELNEGIDLFIYCLRKQKATVMSNIVCRVRDSVPGASMIAVVTELERFETKGEGGMDAWWDAFLEDGLTNGTVVEQMCFGRDVKFDAHLCITTLPRREVDHHPKLRKQRDLSEERIRQLILDTCNREKRRGEYLSGDLDAR